MQDYKSLFLRQSYLDSYEEYEHSLTNEEYPVWDYVVITASNEAQAQAYRMQIDERRAAGKLPRRTRYAVIPDPDGVRVGSGGATLAVLDYIRRDSGRSSFAGLRIFVIHSGGDSKRVPQYSACGKLFSPVPRCLRDGRRSSLFDEFIIGMTALPARMGDGMLVVSGDVLLLFNPLQVDFYSHDAMALSMYESVHTGKDHGVFLRDEEGYVARFLHKLPEEELAAAGAVDARGRVNIDTGAVLFSSAIVDALYSLVDTGEKFAAVVNSTVRLSFYADFLYPLATDATLEEYYTETPEGELTPELHDCRTRLWEILSPFRMKLCSFSPAAFIHFGTTRELLALMTREIDRWRSLDWSPLIQCNVRDVDYAVSCSYISPHASIGRGCYIEDSFIHRDSTVGEGSVLSCVTLQGETVPPHTVLHALKLRDGRFVVRMYGVDDNPKEARLFGRPIECPLWEMPLYPVRDSITEALRATLSQDRSGECLSLKDSFALADTTEIVHWHRRLYFKSCAEHFLALLDCGTPAAAMRGEFRLPLDPKIVTHLAHAAGRSDFFRRLRIYYYVSEMTEGEESRKMRQLYFDTLEEALLGEDAVGWDAGLRICRDSVRVQLPVRANFGGGWTDTPPYCNENGGVVLNAALRINGERPIEATVERIDSPTVILYSRDSGARRSFTTLGELCDCRDPSDAFALAKASLIVSHIIPQDAGCAPSLKAILDRLGGGFCLTTQVHGIPRGSGLGTSSILAGACVRALADFTGQVLTDGEAFDRVLRLEQLMSTGGGWQDQVGGMLPGFKMITSEPGMWQRLEVEQIAVSPETVAELNERFCLIYTGQRRLARNLLRRVMGNYIAAEHASPTTLGSMKESAWRMRRALLDGDIDAFARELDRHWALSRRLDEGCTNTCIDQILNSVSDLIVGRMICGAGGGGFLQVILRRGVTRAMLRERISDVFEDSGASVWDSEFDLL